MLADPDTLEVLDQYDLGLPIGDTFAYTARQPFMRSLLSSYSFFDARDRLSSWEGTRSDSGGGGTDEAPVLEHRGTDDLAALDPGRGQPSRRRHGGLAGRIWTTTVGTAAGPRDGRRAQPGQVLV